MVVVLWPQSVLGMRRPDDGDLIFHAFVVKAPLGDFGAKAPGCAPVAEVPLERSRDGSRRRGQVTVPCVIPEVGAAMEFPRPTPGGKGLSGLNMDSKSSNTPSTRHQLVS